MISLKSLFKSSMIYGTGSALIRAMTFLLLPFYTNELENYGGFILVMTTIALLRICYSHGMGDSFLKVYSQSQDKQKIASTYLIYILAVIACVSSFLILVYVFISPQNESSLIGLLQNKLGFIILIILFDTLNYRIVDILRINSSPIHYIMGQIAGVITTFSITIYMVKQFNANQLNPIYISDHIDCALFAVLSGGIITFIIFSPILFKNLRLNYFSKLYLQKMISLSFRFFPAALFFMFMELLDRYLLKILLVGPNVNDLIGTYSVGCKLASVPMLLISAFNLGWQPFYLSNGNTPESRQKYGQVGTIFVLGILSVGWFMAIVMPWLATLNVPFLNDYPMIGEKFSYGVKIIPIILISHVFYALYIINMPSIYLCDKQNWSPILRIFGAFMNIILNAILIPIWNIEGAAIATAISYGLMFLLLFYKNKKWFPIKLIWSDILMLSALIIASFTLSLLNTTLQYFVIMIIVVYICLLLYKYGIKNLFLLFK